MMDQQLLKNFPPIHISYETILHKKLPTNDSYHIGLAIPYGKKYYLWATHHGNKNTWHLMELNRDRKIIRITQQPEFPITDKLALNTLLYISCCEQANVESKLTQVNFFIEDIYYYQGINTNNMPLSHKLGYIKELLSSHHFPTLYLPTMWDIRKEMPTDIPYPIHHIQFRSLTCDIPYLNQSNGSIDLITKIPEKKDVIQFQPLFANTRKPQYRIPTIFIVMADIKYDIYHLFGYGPNSSQEYVGVSLIPNFEKSKMMNHLFRNIRENENLDLVEESDDEAEFENGKEDKYVNLQKKLTMECVFNHKFRKWVPTKMVDGRGKIVHVGRL